MTRTPPPTALSVRWPGIGTSEVEHVLATQCLVAKKMKNMQVRVEGKLPFGVTAKDIVLAVIGKIGTAGGNGHALEFAGSAIRDLSMEGPHDHLQHGHRGGRPRGHGRRGRRPSPTSKGGLTPRRVPIGTRP